MTKNPTLAIACASFLCAPTHAALLVYEGFNGYTTGTSLNLLSPNANTIGLDTGNTYANDSGGNPASSITIASDGLSFGNLQVGAGSGRAIYSGSAAGVASANIISTTTGSVVWSSYLVRLAAPSASGSNGFELRLNSDSTSSSGSAYYRSAADSRGTASSLPSAAYDLDPTTGTGSVLTTNTIYIIISKFDAGSPGGSSLWALNLSQFNDFVAAARDESFLTAANVTAISQDAKTGTKTWNADGSPAYLEIVGSSGSATVDEIRYGESLADVTPLIPEPTSALLLGLGTTLSLTRRRR